MINYGYINEKDEEARGKGKAAIQNNDKHTHLDNYIPGKLMVKLPGSIGNVGQV